MSSTESEGGPRQCDEKLTGSQVGLFHGAMNREERSRVYEDFFHRKVVCSSPLPRLKMHRNQRCRV